MRLSLLVLILIQTLSLNCFAARSKHFSVYTQYQSYVDIVNSSESDPKELGGDLTVNIEVRLVRIFSATLVVGKSLDGQRSYSGLAFKTDLPGVFLFGGNVNDLIHRKRRKGMQTYFSFANHIIQESGEPNRAVGNRFSLGADIFVHEASFLNLELGLYSIKGDQYLSPTLGFGVEF